MMSETEKSLESLADIRPYARLNLSPLAESVETCLDRAELGVSRGMEFFYARNFSACIHAAMHGMMPNQDRLSPKQLGGGVGEGSDRLARRWRAVVSSRWIGLRCLHEMRFGDSDALVDKSG